MATHDYVIANGTGAAVRSDLNGALAAIVSQNSSATEPSPSYAYQRWADTTAGVMKMRNGANNAWITLYQLDGEWSTIAFENGTAAAPSIYFKDSGTDTGIYSPGADQVGISTGGTVRLTTTTTGITSALPVDVPLGAVGTPSITFTGDLNTGIYSPGADQVAISTSGTEKLIVKSDGKVGIGTSSPSNILHVSGTSSTTALFERTGSNGVFIGLKDGSANNVFLGNTNGVFSVQTPGSSFSDKLVITSAGLVGIGTTPVVDLDVAPAASTATFRIHARSNTTPVAAIELVRGTSTTFGADGSGDYRIKNDTGNLSFEYGDSGVTTERARIDSSGNIFWGPLSGGDYPNYLVADGSIRSTKTYNVTTASAANIFISSNGTLARSTSSIKYKTNVETIEDQYADAILGCRPVWYQSTSEADNPEWGHWGFIAEEVVQIDPRLCFFKEEEDGTLEPEGVQYDRFVPHLLNLIKRQQQAIETLETEVAALKGT